MKIQTFAAIAFLFFSNSSHGACSCDEVSADLVYQAGIRKIVFLATVTKKNTNGAEIRTEKILKGEVPALLFVPIPPHDCAFHYSEFEEGKKYFIIVDSVKNEKERHLVYPSQCTKPLVEGKNKTVEKALLKLKSGRKTN
jgi:hypothetical protein